MSFEYTPYTLPTISFVGGETQDLAFNAYFYQSNVAFSLSACTASFAIIGFLNKDGDPIITKPMEIIFDDTGTVDNKLYVSIPPMDTIDLDGKYVYQITIQDVGGDIEIPSQGIMYITKNINKEYITTGQ